MNAAMVNAVLMRERRLPIRNVTAHAYAFAPFVATARVSLASPSFASRGAVGSFFKPNFARRGAPGSLRCARDDGGAVVGA